MIKFKKSDFWNLKNEILNLLNERISATDQCLDYITEDNNSYELQGIINVNIFHFNHLKEILLRVEKHNEYLSNCYFNRKLNEYETNNSN